MSAAIDELEIDPGFAGFIRQCSERGVGANIVSDGLDLVIATVMERNGLEVPYFANHLVHAGGDRWRLQFPHARDACEVQAGHCKCARTEDYRDHLSVVIGDGRSDFCIAGRADLVLAKAKLLEECRRSGTPCLPFRDFSEVTEQLMAWLDDRANRPQFKVGDDAERENGDRLALGA